MISKEEIKKLIIARLEVLPLNKRISIGSVGEFNRDQLIEHVKKGDSIGDKITKIELNFLRAMKKGFI